ncbi:MAG: DMT family transporter [Terriglobales bacterium]
MPSTVFMSSSAKPRQALADGALLAITCIWGITFPLVKSALRDTNALSFVAVRMSLAAVLLIVGYRLDWRRIPLAAWSAGAVAGAFLAAGYALQTAGLALTSPSAAAFITGTMVVLVPLLLAAFWRRRLRSTAWWGALLALAGLYLLVAYPAAAQAAGSVRTWRGDAMVGGCAVAFALQIIWVGEWAPRVKVGDLAVLQILFAALFTWMMLPAVTTLQWHNTTYLWVAIAITAVLATAVAFAVQTWAQQFTPATHAVVIFAAEPIFATLASAIGWHEHLRAIQILGAALIVAAMVVVEWRPRASSS